MWVWHVQEAMSAGGTPRKATPRGRSFLKVLSEQQRLQKELAAAGAAREAAEARALVSADEAAAAVGMLPCPVCIASVRPRLMTGNQPLQFHACILSALFAVKGAIKLGLLEAGRLKCLACVCRRSGPRRSRTRMRSCTS